MSRELLDQFKIFRRIILEIGFVRIDGMLTQRVIVLDLKVNLFLASCQFDLCSLLNQSLELILNQAVLSDLVYIMSLRFNKSLSVFESEDDLINNRICVTKQSLDCILVINNVPLLILNLIRLLFFI
jgi:hypothetical protein